LARRPGVAPGGDADRASLFPNPKHRQAEWHLAEMTSSVQGPVVAAVGVAFEPRPRLLVAQECPGQTGWMEAVEREYGAAQAASNDVPSVGETAPGAPDLVLLHGSWRWAEMRIRTAAITGTRSSILVVLAAWDPQAAARLLEQAADDVVGPGVDPRELCARVQAILRRCRAERAAAADAELGLRRAERKLLDYLRAHAGRIVSPQELMDHVFGGAHAPDTSLVRVHVSRLRKRLGAETALRTVRGAGYVLELR
jgi:DNA-binding response OmpR family regulator